ncbi:MAG TPA: tetratricopeptide repeat protein, partial [Bacteroidia bacterium]|nr:tetratricopeptide repeat protein [Bacteroidia bacterium]
MTKITKYYIIIFITILQGVLFSQDIKKIVELNNKAQELINTDPLKSKELAEQALSMAKEANIDTLIYISRFNCGVANYFLDKKQEALEDFIANKQLAEKLKDDSKIIESLNGIGNMYKDIDRYESALQTYHEGLALCEAKNIPDKKLLIVSNLAMAHINLGNPDSANYFNYKALSYYREYKSGDRAFLMNVYGSLLGCYSDLKMEDSVLKYSSLAIAIADELGDKHTKAGNTYNIGDFYNKVGKHKEAIKYLEEADALSDEARNPSLEYEIQLGLANAYYNTANYEKSAKCYGKALQLSDKIHEEQTVEKLSEMEVKYETGKKEDELKRLSAEQEISALKVKQSRTLTFISIISVIVFLIIAGVLFKQNKNKKQANALLQKQNDEITHQKKEITDSINYAKRIQLSILPPDKMVK